MTSTGVSGAAGLRRIMASPCRLCELEQIVGGADHRPFLSDLVEAAEQELSKASGRFDLAEHRLDDLLSEAISAAPAGAAELRCHGGDARALARSALAGRVAADIGLDMGEDARQVPRRERMGRRGRHRPPSSTVLLQAEMPAYEMANQQLHRLREEQTVRLFAVAREGLELAQEHREIALRSEERRVGKEC